MPLSKQTTNPINATKNPIKFSKTVQTQSVLDDFERVTDVQPVNSEFPQRVSPALSSRVLQLLPQQNRGAVAHVQQEGGLGGFPEIFRRLRVELGEHDVEPAGEVDAELTAAVLAEPTKQEETICETFFL